MKKRQNFMDGGLKKTILLDHACQKCVNKYVVVYVMFFFGFCICHVMFYLKANEDVVYQYILCS